MYVVGEEEVEAVAEVIRSGKLFRYGVGDRCDRFERRYAEYLGVGHCALSASGTYGLAAALIGLGVGLSMALFVAPADYQQGNTVRIMFIHVPSAWLAMFGYGLMAIAALGTLVWRHPLADVAAKFEHAGWHEDRRPQLYAWDTVHLGGFGHHVTADTVFRALAAGR